MKCGSTAPTWWLRPACLVAPAQLLEMASTTWLPTYLEATAGPHTTGLLHARHDALHAALLMHMNQFHLFTACALGFTFCCCCFVPPPFLTLLLCMWHATPMLCSVVTLMTCLGTCRSTKMEMTTPVISTGGQQGPSGDKMQFPIESKYGEDPDVLPLPNDAR